ncbi:MAG: hypothetical protein GF315_14260 [candidate division Zixibacteria bacterium]|nr:hypothetical protein [candidate division Zixibacteria bacterium]
MIGKIEDLRLLFKPFHRIEFITFSNLILIFTISFLSIVLTGCTSTPEPQFTEVEVTKSQINTVLENIRNRRTVRKFKSTAIPKEHLQEILDAARFAPTAGNLQPWKFVVIQKRQRLDSLKAILQDDWQRTISNHKDLNEDQKKRYIRDGKIAIENVMTAPVYIMVFVDSTVYPDCAVHDGALAAGYLMLAARAYGYGTGYFTSYFPDEVIKSFVKAPENYMFICCTPVGIPEEWPDTPPKKALEEFIVFDKFPE